MAYRGYREEVERVVFAGLMAQIKDVHSLAWSLSEDECEIAEKLFAEHETPGTDEESVVAKSLAYLVHDIDHLLMTDAEVDAGERLLTEMSVRWGS
jgi:hypothetical protein